MTPAQKYAVDIEATKRRYHYHHLVNQKSWLPKCFLPIEEFKASELVMQTAARHAAECIEKMVAQ